MTPVANSYAVDRCPLAAQARMYSSFLQQWYSALRGPLRAHVNGVMVFMMYLR